MDINADDDATACTVEEEEEDNVETCMIPESDQRRRSWKVWFQKLFLSKKKKGMGL